jgi:DNA-binding NarL/FixJ family response regulator
MSIGVALLDDRLLFREGLRLLLETQRDFVVVGEAGDVAGGFALCAAHPTAIAVASPALGAVARGRRVVVMNAQSSAELFDAVRAAARGEVATPAPAASEPQLEVLSARERQVFELLVRGHTNAEIGRMLGISAKTVDTHRTKVLRKIGVHSIVDLVRFAARNSLPLD